MTKNGSKKVVVITSWIVVAVFALSTLYLPGTELQTNNAGINGNKSQEKVPELGIIAPAAKLAGITTLTAWDPIVIIGDDGFTTENGVTVGAGTEENPHIIANYYIDAKDTGDCISIKDTTEHFIIENCTLIGATGADDAGIYLSNVKNGRLRNNVCNNSYIGIYIVSGSSNISINTNTCNKNSQYGIFLKNGTSCTLSSNTCNNNSLIGIDFYESSSNNLTSNNCSNNSFHGIAFGLSSSNSLNNNTCSSNSQNGIYLYSSSSNNILFNNTCDDNGDRGIHLLSSSFNTVTFNLLTGNTNYAISVVSSSISNIIHSNWLWENGDTIYGSPPSNYIHNNFFYPPSQYDADHDGLVDELELFIGTSPILVDTDGDNFLDGYEHVYGTDPLDSNDYPVLWQEDFDRLMDYLDGNVTLLEIVHALATGNEIYLQALNASQIAELEDIRDIIDELNISIGDADHDGLSDLDELIYGTSIVLLDTDCDNLNDGFEVKIGTDPLDDDTDDDGHVDGLEVLAGTDPLDNLDYPDKISPSPDPLELVLLAGAAVLLSSSGIVIYLKKFRRK